MNLALNVKLIKLMKVKDVPYHGDHVTMLIILIVLINGQDRRKLNVRYVRILGIRSKLRNNERNWEILCMIFIKIEILNRELMKII